MEPDLTVSIKHEYSDVNLGRDIADLDYENKEIEWGNQEDFEIIKKLGRGKYSNVFEGYDIEHRHPVAIKILRAISKSKIKRELHITSSLKHDNIVRVIKLIRCPESKAASLVLEYVPHQDFRECYPLFNLADIKHYMRELLTTLDYVHSQGVMHRDIKPHNVLINHHKRSLKIVDFGLAEYYFPEKDYSSKVASLYYKAPEILLGSVRYDYRIDIWAVGMMLAGMIFHKTPLVQGIDALDQVYKLSKFLGTQEILKFAIQNQKFMTEAQQLREEMKMALENPGTRQFPKTDMTEFINKDNKDFATPEALDLLRGLLRLNPNERLTAKLALEHPFLKKK